MNNFATNHPSFEQLSAFLLGHARVGDRREIERHVESCDECCATLAEVPSDTMAKLARDAATVFGSGIDTEPRASERTRQGDALPQQLVDHPRYHVTKVLGSGGMGTVYKAEHRVMERPVALKVINPQLVSRPSAVKRFELEVRAAAKLSHPNIVAAHDAETAGDLHFLVMEFVEGATLATQVEEGKPLSIRYACEFIRQAALGLQHAHEQGMVHRDIKPHNLKIRRDTKEIKILDFGLARFASEADAIDAGNGETVKGGLTRSDSVIGTPDYMAPEQFTDPRSADIRADIYSLGCTMYFLLTGRPPFAGASLIGKLSAHRTEEPPSLNGFRPEISEELMAIVQRMIAKQPADRYQTPQEVADALEQMADQSPATPKVVPPPLPASLDQAAGKKQIPLAWILSTTVLLLACGIFALIMSVPPRKPRVLYVLPPYELIMPDYESRELLESADVEVTTACYLKQIQTAKRGHEKFNPELTADMLLSEVDATEYDAVIFVGAGLWEFWCWNRDSSEPCYKATKRIMDEFANAKKPVACFTNGRNRLVGTLDHDEPFEPQYLAFAVHQNRIWSGHELEFADPTEDDSLIVAATEGGRERFLNELLKKLGRTP